MDAELKRPVAVMLMMRRERFINIGFLKRGDV
jgi:hypothetical protein